MISVLSSILFVIGMAFVVFFFYSLLKYRNRVSGLFAIMCLSIAIYVIGYSFELRARDVEQIIFFLKLEYFGTSSMAAFWLLLSYKFYFNKNASFRLSIAIMIIPVLTLFFSATNEHHHLIYLSVSAVKYDGFIVASLAKGPWYFVNITYSYLAVLAGAIAFYKVWRYSLYSMKTQAFLMFIGTICPIIVNVIYLCGLSPYGLDLIPFGLSVSTICYFIALFRYDFLEMGEIIRSVAFSEISDGIIVVDDKCRLIDFNRSAQEIFDWLENKNIGMNLVSIEKAKEITEHKSGLFEMEIVGRDKTSYYEFRITDLKEENRIVGAVYFIRDITKQKEMIQALENMASYDSLTQVFNRRKFMVEAEKAVAGLKSSCGYFSIMMIDIDYFKRINDKYGHLTGDEVIRMVADACKEGIVSKDIIGRYGGEEFVVLLPDIDLDYTFYIAENIRQNIESMKIIFDELIIKVTVSIGVASESCSGEVINIMEVINRADEALYNAKNNGRNQVCAKGVSGIEA